MRVLARNNHRAPRRGSPSQGFALWGVLGGGRVGDHWRSDFGSFLAARGLTVYGEGGLAIARAVTAGDCVPQASASGLNLSGRGLSLMCGSVGQAGLGSPQGRLFVGVLLLRAKAFSGD